MNSQSLGAILILAGLFMLWALWAKNSPFAGKQNPWSGPKETGPSGGGSSGFS